MPGTVGQNKLNGRSSISRQVVKNAIHLLPGIYKNPFTNSIRPDGVFVHYFAGIFREFLKIGTYGLVTAKQAGIERRIFQINPEIFTIFSTGNYPGID